MMGQVRKGWFPSVLKRLSPAAVVIALCLLAARPILGPSLPCSDDAAFHVLRLVQLDHLLDQGVFYSRWAPDMALGYGYPFSNFYAPLSYYFAAAVSRLGFGLNLGARVTFALGIVGSGLAAYLLARDHLSRRAALVAAVAYAYAPYQAYDVLSRGNLAESAAWPLLPLALWAMGRLARGGGWRWAAAAALSYAAVLLTHNVFALIFSPLWAAYGLILAWKQGERIRHQLLIALALGLGLAAFFWLPALAERGLVHSDRLLTPPDSSYWNNFIGLDEILAPPQTVNPDLINPSPPRALGLIPTLLGLPALVALAFSPASRLSPPITRPSPLASLTTFFFAIALALYVWMMTPASQFVWDTLPLIEFVQFPWRLLGPAALCLSMLVGRSISLLPSNRIGGLLAGAAAGLLTLGSLFWLDPRYCPGLETPTVEDILAYEQATGLIGTTSKGEYLPRTVAQMPAAPAATLLETPASIVEQRGHALRTEAVVDVPTAMQVVANIFDYPGWRVEVDGGYAPITPSPDHGLITFSLPAGRHRVTLRFGETPLRLTADLVSAASLAVTLGLLLLPGPRTGRRVQLAFDQITPWAWISLGVALFATAAWLLPQLNTPLRRPRLDGGVLQGVAVPLAASFEDGLQLLGYEQQVTSDGQFRYDLYWTVYKSVTRRHQTTISLADSAGVLWSPKQTTLPRGFREPPAAPFWELGQYAQDSHLVSVLPGTPPGVYRPVLTLFDRETLVPTSWLDAAGHPAAPNLGLNSVTVTRPRRMPDPADVPMQYRFDIDLGPLQLVGANLDREEARPGDLVLVTLFWQVPKHEERETRSGGLPDLAARLALVHPAEAAQTWNLPPVSADWPTSQWREGDFWRGQHLLQIPGQAKDGRHTWQLTILDAAGVPVGRPVALGQLNVSAPDRIWELPDSTHPADVRYSAESGATFARLVGYDLGLFTPGDRLELVLIWQSLAETETDYRVFAHLLGPDGNMVAQSDAVPANWSRPTPGWAPGEFVADPHSLDIPAGLPPGDYLLTAGFYELATGNRLQASQNTIAVLRAP